MRKWSLKRLWKESPPFKWTVIIAIILSLSIFGIQQYQRDKDKQSLEDQFSNIEGICSEKNNCTRNESTIYVLIDEENFEGNCPHVNLEKEANATFREGAISLWTKLNNLDKDNKRVIFDMIDYNDNSFLELYIIKNQIIQLGMHDNLEQDFILSYDYKKPIDEWIFIVATWNTKMINLYINGESKNSISLNDVDFSTNIKDWYMGSSHKKTFCLNGLLDEVGMWKTLDKRLINILYNDGEGCAYPFDNC